VNERAVNSGSELFATLPFIVDGDGKLASSEESSVEARCRLVLELEPGERPLSPRLGCSVHRLASIETAEERELAAALIELALETNVPGLGVHRVEVIAVTRFAESSASGAPRGTLTVRLGGRGEPRDLEILWFAPLRGEPIRASTCHDERRTREEGHE
jgi:hypothetical protein